MFDVDLFVCFCFINGSSGTPTPTASLKCSSLSLSLSYSCNGFRALIHFTFLLLLFSFKLYINYFYLTRHRNYFYNFSISSLVNPVISTIVSIGIFFSFIFLAFSRFFSFAPFKFWNYRFLAGCFAKNSSVNARYAFAPVHLVSCNIIGTPWLGASARRMFLGIAVSYTRFPKNFFISSEI